MSLIILIFQIKYVLNTIFNLLLKLTNVNWMNHYQGKMCDSAGVVMVH